jgi:hypothetical protein
MLFVFTYIAVQHVLTINNGVSIVHKLVVKLSNTSTAFSLQVEITGTRIPDPPLFFPSFGPSRDYGMDLCLGPNEEKGGSGIRVPVVEITLSKCLRV